MVNLAWRVNTGELYRNYCRWVDLTAHKKIPIEDIWGIIQLAFPWVTIIGQDKGRRFYTGMRRNNATEGDSSGTE